MILLLLHTLFHGFIYGGAIYIGGYTNGCLLK